MEHIADERDVYLDPIAHEPVDPIHAPGKSFYQGHMYYFVSKANKEVFDDNPALWIPAPHGSVNSSNIMPEDE